jgi:hypothetical protein
MGISFNNRKDDILAISIQTKELKEKASNLSGVFETVVKEFS